MSYSADTPFYGEGDENMENEHPESNNSNLPAIAAGPSTSSTEHGEFSGSITNSRRSQTTISTFDKTLAARHEYLGDDLEDLSGTTLHDEGSVLWLPILLELDVILVPGQTLPLTASSPDTVSMLKEVIAKDKTFGVVCVKDVPNEKKALAKYGTTAEIFQYQEGGNAVNIKIKAKGRQRFRLLEQERNRPSILRAKVVILPEISLLSPLHSARFTSLDRLRHSRSRKLSALDAGLTSWPEWVYRQYDSHHLVKKVLEELENLKLGISVSRLPTDPVDLSFWAAQCLPIDDIHRVGMLSLNTEVERLQYALILLAKCQKLYCSNCGNELADQRDVYSMSVEGPQGTYCNSGGYVHEILTLHKASGMNFIGDKPTENYSWFPGYAWTIANCSSCDDHKGWLFTAVQDDLKPVRFWGLTRRSVTTHYKDDDEDFDPEDYIYSRIF